MPLNMQDPYLRAERQPPALIALGARLKQAYGVGADNFGIKGNEFHYTGFHRSRAFLLNSVQGDGGDYSTRGTRNASGNENNNSAFDFTPGVWGSTDNRQKMKTLTKRLHDAAVRRDPALRDWFEFAGTLDGVQVVTFYADGGAFKSPFDNSHLDHIHGSKYRDASDNDNTALGDIMLGLDDEEDDMGASLGPIKLELGVTSLNIPPVSSGAADPRPAWLNVCNDTFGVKYALRIFLTSGDGAWSPLPNVPNGVLILDSGRRFSQQLPTGTAALSVSRYAVLADGTAVKPDGVNEAYDGSLSCVIERGPVVK